MTYNKLLQVSLETTAPHLSIVIYICQFPAGIAIVAVEHLSLAGCADVSCGEPVVA